MSSPETAPTMQPTPPEQLRAQGRSVPEYTRVLELPDGSEKVVPKSYVMGQHELNREYKTTRQMLNPKTGMIETKEITVKSLQPRKPRFTSALYDSSTRRDFDYETPDISSPLDPALPPVPLNPDIFPGDNNFEEGETGDDVDRSFTVELLEDSPWLQAQRNPEEQAEFNITQERLGRLARTQRVLEYVGRRINKGDDYMHRMSDEEYDEYGEELRPATKEELKIARKLEKIERERREELHHALILSDPNYAEIKGRDSMTPARKPGVTKKEIRHHEKNRAAYEHKLHRIKELDREFRELMTSPMRQAAQIRQKYEDRFERQERANQRRQSRIDNRAERKQRHKDQREAARWAAQTIGRLTMANLAEKSENLKTTGRSAKKAFGDVIVDPAKEITVNLREAARPEINKPPKHRKKHAARRRQKKNDKDEGDEK